VSQNIAALLQALGRPAPCKLLDFGCGHGRDLKTFKDMGHQPIGLEGAAALAAMARQHSGCEVWEQNFLALDLPAAHFDGVFANAVLFHLPSQALPRVLAQLFATLKPGGALFSSNPRGEGQEGWRGERYGSYHDWPAWQAHMLSAGFTAVRHYYRPVGLPRDQQPWLASVWRRPAL
jgi:SAM-dependent methyltransferase